MSSAENVRSFKNLFIDVEKRFCGPLTSFNVMTAKAYLIFYGITHVSGKVLRRYFLISLQVEADATASRDKDLHRDACDLKEVVAKPKLDLRLLRTA